MEKKSPCGIHVLVCAEVCWFPFFLFFFFFTMAPQAGALTHGEEKPLWNTCAGVCRSLLVSFFSLFFFFTMAPQAGALTRGEEKQGRVRKEGGEME